MSPERFRWIAAAVVAGVGLTLAGRSLWKARSIERARPMPVAASPEAARRLEGISFDSFPTEATTAGICKEASSRVLARASGDARSGVFSGPRAQDLADALGERLLATLAPDWSRDVQAMIRRGASLSPEPPSSEQLKLLESGRARGRLAPLSLDQLEVRVLYREGVRVAPPTAQEGFRIATLTTRGPARMDIPDDPERARLDVVEVRVPMRLADVQGVARDVLVGYQFGWNDRRRQWIPLANAVYCDPAVVVPAPPF